MPEGLINEIRSKTDLVDLVSKHLSLNKKGNNYWGICPFHEDSNPSLSVAADKQIYKCFTCGAGGNAFTFLQNYNSISFMEAVEILAQDANIDVSAYVQTKAAPKDPKKEILYEIMNEVGQFTSYQLHTEGGKSAKELMRQRDYDDVLLQTFGVGVVYDNDQITRFLQAKGFKDEDLVKADVSSYRNDQLKDVFYNRIMFPIHDPYGRLIAFSGRTMDAHSKVKYINTGETELYVKGNVLYNFHRAKDKARQQGYVVVSEGVTDTIAFTKAGIVESVSLLGVACTPAQIRLLKQCSNTIVLAFDGDVAGVRATYKIGKELHQNGLQVRVWRNDTGLDPDDALRQEGAQVLTEGLEKRLHWYDFILKFASLQYGLESFENKQRLVQFVLKELAGANELERNHYVGKLASMTNFTSEVLLSQMSDQETQVQARTQAIQHIPIKQELKPTTVLAERNILSLMLNSKDAAYQYRDKLGFMQDPLANRLALTILDVYRSQDTLNIADLISKDIPQELKDFAIQLESELYLDEFSDLVLYEEIANVQSQLNRKAVSDLKLAAQQTHDEDNRVAHLQRAMDLLKKERRTLIDDKKD